MKFLPSHSYGQFINNCIRLGYKPTHIERQNAIKEFLDKSWVNTIFWGETTLFYQCLQQESNLHDTITSGKFYHWIIEANMKFNDYFSSLDYNSPLISYRLNIQDSNLRATFFWREKRKKKKEKRKKKKEKNLYLDNLPKQCNILC